MGPIVVQHKFHKKKYRRCERMGGKRYIYNTTMARENDREASRRGGYEGNKVEYEMI